MWTSASRKYYQFIPNTHPTSCVAMTGPNTSMNGERLLPLWEKEGRGRVNQHLNPGGSQQQQTWSLLLVVFVVVVLFLLILEYTRRNISQCF